MTVLVIVATGWALLSFPLAVATGRLIRSADQKSVEDIPTAWACGPRSSWPVPTASPHRDEPTDLRGGVVSLPGA